jgi:hypothetical protein
MECKGKLKFNKKEEAEDYIRSLYLSGHSDVRRNSKGLEAYKCNTHSCWHMGHPKNYDDNPVARVNILLDKLKKS